MSQIWYIERMNSRDIGPSTIDLLTRGVGDFIDPEGQFRKKLEIEPHNVVIKFGVDPTRPDIHLGHAVVFRKLRTFQDLGCKVIFLVGDVTAQIGDPTGKSKVRPEIDQQEIEANMKTYLDQVGKILKLDPAVFSWTRNSDWFVGINDIATPEGIKIELDVQGEKISLPPLPANDIIAKTFVWNQSRMQKNKINNYSFLNVLSILRSITHARLIGRDMFQDRIEKGEELYMHEMMYPVLQGIDSSALAHIYGSCDLEVGGTDQTFNMLMGRDIMKLNKQSQQAVLAFELLEGLDGKEKMSKSLNNYVAITDAPEDMYGKIMSIPDLLIPRYFKLCTYTPLEDIALIKKALEKGKENPRDIKMRLAREIVEIYHGQEKGLKAEEAFVNTFRKGGIPDDVISVSVEKGTPLLSILRENDIVSSNTDYRRLVAAGAIESIETNTTIDVAEATVLVTATYRIGKNRFIKIIVE